TAHALSDGRRREMYAVTELTPTDSSVDLHFSKDSSIKIVNYLGFLVHRIILPAFPSKSLAQGGA
ncbi:unnamed protein product, partial [marine sediment metagenome]